MPRILPHYTSMERFDASQRPTAATPSDLGLHLTSVLTPGEKNRIRYLLSKSFAYEREDLIRTIRRIQLERCGPPDSFRHPTVGAAGHQPQYLNIDGQRLVACTCGYIHDIRYMAVAIDRIRLSYRIPKAPAGRPPVKGKSFPKKRPDLETEWASERNPNLDPQTRAERTALRQKLLAEHKAKVQAIKEGDDPRDAYRQAQQAHWAAVGAIEDNADEIAECDARAVWLIDQHLKAARVGQVKIIEAAKRRIDPRGGGELWRNRLEDLAGYPAAPGDPAAVEYLAYVYGQMLDKLTADPTDLTRLRDDLAVESYIHSRDPWPEAAMGGPPPLSATQRAMGWTDETRGEPLLAPESSPERLPRTTRAQIQAARREAFLEEPFDTSFIKATRKRDDGHRLFQLFPADYPLTEAYGRAEA